MRFNATEWTSLWEDSENDVSGVLMQTPDSQSRDFNYGYINEKTSACKIVTTKEHDVDTLAIGRTLKRSKSNRDAVVHPRNIKPTTNYCYKQQHSTAIDEQIKTSLEDRSNNDNLIGDGTKNHTLPTVEGRHKDLKCITHKTLADVLDGQYSDVINKYVIVDCRYPYEYNGGHIENAVNLNTSELVEQLLNIRSRNEKTILIFHCEFSSERGPKLLRHLREADRRINLENYPELCYPEIYLLLGGYREFFENEKEHGEHHLVGKCIMAKCPTTNKSASHLVPSAFVYPQSIQTHCTPQSYVPMTKKEFASELRYFRSKSKSWNGFERRKCLRL